MALFKRRKKEDKSGEAESKTEKKGKTSMKDLYGGGDESEKKKKTKSAGKKTDSATQSTQDKKTASKPSTPEKTKKNGKAYEVLRRPVITERSGDLGVQNKYVFEVADDSNKVEVAKAIEEVYGVKPVKVNMMRMKGKRVRFGRIYGKRKDWKKAVVTLPQGKSINVYEGV